MVSGGTYVPAASSTIATTIVISVVPASPTVCTISGGSVSFVGAGICEVRADAAATANYEAAFVSQLIPVSKGSQTITITSGTPTPTLFSGATYTATATASSGLAVSFTSGTPSVCTVSGGVFSFLNAGSCQVLADQGGNVNFDPAPQVVFLFVCFVVFVFLIVLCVYLRPRCLLLWQRLCKLFRSFQLLRPALWSESCSMWLPPRALDCP